MMSRFTCALVGLSALVAVTACSSDSTDSGKQGGNKTDDSGAAACDDNAVASATTLCKPKANPCDIHSGFAGDDYCIPPPPAGKGIQIHFGPSDYNDPAEIAKYVIKPGEEFNAYGLATLPEAGEHWYNYVQIRMRPGSHHLINQLVSGTDDMPDGFVDGKVGCPGSIVSGFPGTQNLIRNMPPAGIQAPENEGIGSKIPANTRMCLNHHGYNFGSDDEQLREAWINVWYVDEKDVTQRANPVFIIAGPFGAIPPHTQTVLKAAVNADGDGRIINLFGHRHAWTDRFAVWQNDNLVYDSWHWEESIAFDYDSVTKNPPLDPDKKVDGAVTGVLDVKDGDKVSIECDIDNKSDNTLTFKNELYTGEMCILFGSTVESTVRTSLPAGIGGVDAEAQ